MNCAYNLRLWMSNFHFTSQFFPLYPLFILVWFYKFFDVVANIATIPTWNLRFREIFWFSKFATTRIERMNNQIVIFNEFNFHLERFPLPRRRFILFWKLNIWNSIKFGWWVKFTFKIENKNNENNLSNFHFNNF